MNLLQAIHCNQYAELKKNGKDASKARINGIILITAMIILNLMTVVLFMNIFAKNSAAFESIDRFFHKFRSGRGAGQSIAIILFIVIAPVIYFLIGTKKYFNKTVSSFELLPEEEKKQVQKRGLYYVIISFSLFMLVFVIGLF